MPPKIKQFGTVEVTTSEDEEGGLPPNARAMAATSTTLSDEFSSSLSSNDEAALLVGEESASAKTSGVAGMLLHPGGKQSRDGVHSSATPQHFSPQTQVSATPMRKPPLARSHSPPSRETAGAAVIAASSPLDVDVASADLKDCYSPTGTATAMTSPPTATHHGEGAREGDESTSPTGLSPPPELQESTSQVREPAALHRSPIQVKKFAPPPPPPPPAISSSSSSSIDDGDSGSEGREARADSGAPRLQGHSSNGKESRVEVVSDLTATASSTTTGSRVAAEAVAPATPPRKLQAAKGLLNSLFPDPEWRAQQQHATSSSPSSDKTTDSRLAESGVGRGAAEGGHRQEKQVPLADAMESTQPCPSITGECPPSNLPHLTQQPSVETINVSLPTTLANESSTAVEGPSRSRPARASSQKAKHADCIAWASSRQTALDQLRAELARTAEAKPGQHESHGQVHARTPPKSRAKPTAQQGDRPTPSPRPQRQPTPRSPEGSSPSQLEQPHGVTPSKTPGNTTATGPNISGISQISPDRHPDVVSILLENPDLLYAGAHPVPASRTPKQAAGSHRVGSPTTPTPTARPPPAAAATTMAAGSSSPVNRSGTVTPPRQTLLRQRTGSQRVASHSPQMRSPSGPPVAEGKGPASRTPSSSTVSVLYNLPGVNATFLAQQLRRKEALKKEMEAKRMAECTFQPTVSPGSQSIMAAKARAARTRKDELAAAMEERTLQGTPERPQSRSPPLSARGVSAPEGVSSVYERLYPPELAEAQARRQLRKQERAFRDLAREEMLLLRRHLGALTAETEARKHDIMPFLSNILEVDCRNKTVAELVGSGVLVQTSYESPMSIAMQQERAHAKHHRSRQQGEAEGGSADPGSSVPTDTDTLGTDGEESREYRLALFDEFLLRQNAHYFNRARTIQRIEDYITPEFKPVTNAKSATLMKSMVERTVLEETNDAEVTTKIEAYRRKGIPVSDLLVRKHRSKYEDPCTFSPKVSAVAERARSAHGKPRTKEETYDNLYRDHSRQQRAKEEARKRAEAAALEDCTFSPNTNRKRNETVESLLNAKRAGEYSCYLRERREAAQAAREAERKRMEEEKLKAEAEEDTDERTATEDLAACTFKPKTSKTPAYISKMASSFGIVRKMDVEF